MIFSQTEEIVNNKNDEKKFGHFHIQRPKIS